MLTSAGRYEIGNAHINANHRGTWYGLGSDYLNIGESEPTQAVSLVELYTAVELPHLVRLGVREGCFVVRSQFDRHGNGVTLLKRADGQPVIIGRIVGRLQFDHIDIGLNTRGTQHGHVPFTPYRLFCFCATGAIRLLFLVTQEVILILLIGDGPITAPGLRNACRLHNGYPMPALREGCVIERITQLVGLLIGTKYGHVLLTEREVDRGQGIKRSKLAAIGLEQTDMRHGSGDALWFA